MLSLGRFRLLLHVEAPANTPATAGIPICSCVPPLEVGMFVHASQIEQVRQAYPYIAKMRLVVSQANYNDKMHLQCEVTDNKYLKEDVTNMLDRVSSTLKKVTKLTGTIEFVALGSLADDGKVIDDLRTID